MLFLRTSDLISSFFWRIASISNSIGVKMSQTTGFRTSNLCCCCCRCHEEVLRVPSDSQIKRVADLPAPMAVGQNRMGALLWKDWSKALYYSFSLMSCLKGSSWAFTRVQRALTYSHMDQCNLTPLVSLQVFFSPQPWVFLPQFGDLKGLWLIYFNLFPLRSMALFIRFAWIILAASFPQSGMKSH